MQFGVLLTSLPVTFNVGRVGLAIKYSLVSVSISNPDCIIISHTSDSPCNLSLHTLRLLLPVFVFVSEIQATELLGDLGGYCQRYIRWREVNSATGHYSIYHHNLSI